MNDAGSFGSNLGTFAMSEDTIMGIIVGGSDPIPDWFRNTGVYAEDQRYAQARLPGQSLQAHRWLAYYVEKVAY